jgi:hypothetical protein
VRFVLANRLMVHVGGTEVHLVTLADHLRRLGHEAVIYAPELGPFADHVRDRGIDVVNRPEKLPGECDVVFAQDTIVAYEMTERYPQALNVFRVCGDVFDFQLPPQLEGVVDLIVVLSDRYERVAQSCSATTRLLRLSTPVDVDRLVPVGDIRERPRRALVLGNYGDRYELVREVWGRQGVEVEEVGVPAANETFDVAASVADADIVVGKSRAALDAMACGRAVYVYDLFGGDGWVTPDAYPALEADHFAGQATDRVIGEAELAADLAGYTSGMGRANRDLVLQHHNARDHVEQLLAAIATRRPGERPDAPFRELGRLTTLQWSWYRLAHDLRHIEGDFHARVVRAEQAEAQALQDLAATQAQLDAMRRTRAWRLASRYWRLRQRLKGAGPRRRAL